MASKNHQLTNDIYLSYETKAIKKIIKIYDALVMGYSMRVWMDIKELQEVNDDLQLEISKALNESKMIICCISKTYIKSTKCKTEITLAYAIEKPMIILLLEQFKQNEFEDMFFAIESLKKEHIIDDPKLAKNVICLLLDKNFMKSVEEILGRKLTLRIGNLSLKLRYDFYKLSESGASTASCYDFSKVDFRKSQSDLSKLACVEIDETNDIITTIDAEIKLCKLIKLEKFKSTPFLCNTYGFKRICYMESKRRYLVTSSFCSLLLAVDLNGNWIDKRNPGGLLKRPTAICVNSKSEVFIGDTEANCVHIFDSNFKFIKSIGEEFLSGGLSAMNIDEQGDRINDLYVADIYEGSISIVDLFKTKLKKTISISCPAFMKLHKEYLFVLSASECILMIEKQTFKLLHAIQIKNAGFLNGIHVDKHLNIYTTSHEIIEEQNYKSKEAYLNLINIDKNLSERYYLCNLQVNDIFIKKGRIIVVSDINVETFNFDHSEIVKLSEKRLMN
jgi:hypothetical protein